MANVNVPTGVKVIAVLNYIGAVGLLLLAIMVFVGSGGALSTFGASEFGALFASMGLVLGIILIGLAVLAFFVGRGLWKAQNWARILTIVGSIIVIVFGLLGIIMGDMSSVGSVVIQAIVGGYLMFSSNVKAVFKGGPVVTMKADAPMPAAAKPESEDKDAEAAM